MKIELFDFVVLSLATYRLTRLFIDDDIMHWFRLYWFEIHLDEMMETYLEPRPGREWLAKLFSCYWCLGFWMSILVFTGYCYNVYYATIICVPLALSAVVGWIKKIGDE